jgi:hypothetical protein
MESGEHQVESMEESAASRHLQEEASAVGEAENADVWDRTTPVLIIRNSVKAHRAREASRASPQCGSCGVICMVRP